MATNPVASLPNADVVREALEGLRAVRRLRGVRRQRHRRCLPHPPAGARLGREGRHGHQFRARHLAPATVPAAARRGAAGLVDHRRGRAAPGLRRGLRLASRRRHLPRACRPVGFRERRQRATSTSARLAASRRSRLRELAPFAGRRRTGDGRAAGAFFAEGGFFHPDVARASSRRRRAPPVQRDGRTTAAAQHRAGARPVAHHDPHRQNRRVWPVIARSPWSNCIPTDADARGLADGDIAQVTSAWGRAALRVHRDGRVTPRRCLRSHPLDGPASRAAGRINAVVNPRSRSDFRPARTQGTRRPRGPSPADMSTAASCCRGKKLALPQSLVVGEGGDPRAATPYLFADQPPT